MGKCELLVGEQRAREGFRIFLVPLKINEDVVVTGLKFFRYGHCVFEALHAEGDIRLKAKFVAQETTDLLSRKRFNGRSLTAANEDFTRHAGAPECGANQTMPKFRRSEETSAGFRSPAAETGSGCKSAPPSRPWDRR